MEDLSAHIGMLENLLRDLYPKLDSSSAQQIDQTLKKVRFTYYNLAQARYPSRTSSFPQHFELTIWLYVDFGPRSGSTGFAFACRDLQFIKSSIGCC